MFRDLWKINAKTHSFLLFQWHSGWKLVKKSHFQSFEFWRQKIKIFGNLIIFGVKIQMRLLGWFLNTVHCFLHTKIVDDHMFIEIGTELLFFADQQKKDE